MTFRELFEKYQKGTATPEEAALIESELEKNEVINAYLASQLLETPEVPLPLETSPQLRQVKNSVRRKFWKMTTLCCVILILFAVLLRSVFLPLYNSRFYDPAQPFENGPDYISPLDVDLQIFTHLACPGWALSSSHAQPLGLGRYDITLSLFHQFAGQETHHLRVTRGEVPYPIASIPFHTMPSGAFYDKGSTTVVFVDENGNETTGQPEEDRQFYLDTTAQMPKGAYLSAYVSLKEDLTLEQLVRLRSQYPSLSFSWAAVRVSNDWYFTELGFPIEYGGLVLRDIPDLKAYDCLELNGASWENAPPSQQAETLEQFFTSMLSYMSTREEFLQAFCNFNGINAEMFASALEYVEENGVAVYGLLLCGSPEDMLALCEDPQIHSFQVADAKFSILQ